MKSKCPKYHFYQKNLCIYECISYLFMDFFGTFLQMMVNMQL